MRLLWPRSEIRGAAAQFFQGAKRLSTRSQLKDEKLAEASSMADGLQRSTQQLKEAQDADVSAIREQMHSMRASMPAAKGSP